MERHPQQPSEPLTNTWSQPIHQGRETVQLWQQEPVACQTHPARKRSPVTIGYHNNKRAGASRHPSKSGHAERTASFNSSSGVATTQEYGTQAVTAFQQPDEAQITQLQYSSNPRLRSQLYHEQVDFVTHEDVPHGYQVQNGEPEIVTTQRTKEDLIEVLQEVTDSVDATSPDHIESASFQQTHSEHDVTRALQQTLITALDHFASQQSRQFTDQRTSSQGAGPYQDNAVNSSYQQYLVNSEAPQYRNRDNLLLQHSASQQSSNFSHPNNNQLHHQHIRRMMQTSQDDRLKNLSGIYPQSSESQNVPPLQLRSGLYTSAAAAMHNVGVAAPSNSFTYETSQYAGRASAKALQGVATSSQLLQEQQAQQNQNNLQQFYEQQNPQISNKNNDNSWHPQGNRTKQQNQHLHHSSVSGSFHQQQNHLAAQEEAHSHNQSHGLVAATGHNHNAQEYEQEAEYYVTDVCQLQECRKASQKLKKIQRKYAELKTRSQGTIGELQNTITRLAQEKGSILSEQSRRVVSHREAELKATHYKELYEREKAERDKLSTMLSSLMSQQEQTQQLLIRQASKEHIREGSNQEVPLKRFKVIKSSRQPKAQTKIEYNKNTMVAVASDSTITEQDRETTTQEAVNFYSQPQPTSSCCDESQQSLSSEQLKHKGNQRSNQESEASMSHDGKPENSSNNVFLHTDDLSAVQSDDDRTPNQQQENSKAASHLYLSSAEMITGHTPVSFGLKSSRDPSSKLQSVIKSHPISYHHSRRPSFAKYKNESQKTMKGARNHHQDRLDQNSGHTMTLQQKLKQKAVMASKKVGLSPRKKLNKTQAQGVTSPPWTNTQGPNNNNASQLKTTSSRLVNRESSGLGVAENAEQYSNFKQWLENEKLAIYNQQKSLARPQSTAALPKKQQLLLQGGGQSSTKHRQSSNAMNSQIKKAPEGALTGSFTQSQHNRCYTLVQNLSSSLGVSGGPVMTQSQQPTTRQAAAASANILHHQKSYSRDGFLFNSQNFHSASVLNVKKPKTSKRLDK